ncbi:MAG: response regulator transcription factor [Acidimicrobiales bacterium]
MTLTEILPSAQGAQGAQRAPIRVVVVEDESLYRDLLRMALERAGFEVVATFVDPESALRDSAALVPDVALLDIELGSAISGVEVGIRLKRVVPALGVVLLSNHLSPEFVGALPTDVVGGWSCLSKRTVSDVDALRRAIIGAAHGLMVLDAILTRAGSIRANSPLGRLSPRQREIVELIAQGYSNRAVAERLVLTEKSVENHITRICRQVGIDAHDPATHQRVQVALLYADLADTPAYAHGHRLIR